MNEPGNVSAVRRLMKADAAILDGLGIELETAGSGSVTRVMRVVETMINSQRRDG